MESRRATKVDTETDQVKSAGEDASRPGEIKGRGLEAEADRPSQDHTAESGDGERNEGWAVRAHESDAPAEVLRVLGQTKPLQNAPAQGSDLPQGTVEEEFLAASQEDGTAGASVTAELRSTVPGESVMAPDTTNPQTALSQGASVPGATQHQATSAAQPMRTTSGTPTDQLLDPMAEPAVKAVDHEAGEQRGTPTQEPHSDERVASVQPTTEGGKPASHVTPELSRLDAAGPQLVRLVEQPAPQKQADAPAHPNRAPHSPLPSSDAGGEERAGTSMAIEPQGLQAVSDAGRRSEYLWSEQHEGHSASEKNPWAAPAPMAGSESDFPGDHSAQAMTAGNAASPQPRPVDSRPVSPAGSASSLASAHDLEPFIPTMSRSVVFEIAEPDLGRINIRVAMANERVHTYLSSDRSEVGQFLINGQDRLQSALQSNGLEMGQFRVDIDRQNAGRSFQQGPPQDQSRMWQQAANGTPGEAGYFDRHDEVRLSYAGRLNLVA